jgi:hypothetical protein
MTTDSVGHIDRTGEIEGIKGKIRRDKIPMSKYKN